MLQAHDHLSTKGYYGSNPQDSLERDMTIYEVSNELKKNAQVRFRGRAARIRRAREQQQKTKRRRPPPRKKPDQFSLAPIGRFVGDARQNFEGVLRRLGDEISNPRFARPGKTPLRSGRGRMPLFRRMITGR